MKYFLIRRELDDPVEVHRAQTAACQMLPLWRLSWQTTVLFNEGQLRPLVQWMLSCCCSCSRLHHGSVHNFASLLNVFKLGFKQFQAAVIGIACHVPYAATCYNDTTVVDLQREKRALRMAIRLSPVFLVALYILHGGLGVVEPSSDPRPLRTTTSLPLAAVFASREWRFGSHLAGETFKE